MAQSFTNFSGSNGAANQPTSFVAADGFVGAPVAGFNANAPVFSAVTFPSGMTLPASSSVTTATGITAHAGGGQANAVLLTALYNQVTTVGTAADSVKLKAAVVGATQIVRNDAATNSMQVFGSGTDTINGVASATGVAVAAGHEAQFVCYVAGAWYGPIALA